MKAKIKALEGLTIDCPSVGNHVLQLYPGKQLPEGFERFQSTIDKIFNKIPHVEGVSNEHLITIDSKYFPVDSALRREGLHIDGNFCADPEFQIRGKKVWGGTETVVTWGRTVYEALENGNYKIVTPFVNEFGVTPTVGKYVSKELGGIFCISDLEGCEAYEGEFDVEVESEGSLEKSRQIIEAKGKKVLFEKNKLYFMTSNTPHESLIIKAGNRRTLIRVTLAHNYPNSKLLL